MTDRNTQTSLQFDDELDGLLHQWHSQNAARAQANREALMQRISISPLLLGEGSGVRVSQTSPTPVISVRRNIFSHRYLRVAASLALLVTLIGLLIPLSHSPVQAAMCEVMLPEGGKLQAFDDERNLIGPCPLKHTDVDVAITGPFARITLKQDVALPQALRSPFRRPARASG